MIAFPRLLGAGRKSGGRGSSPRAEGVVGARAFCTLVTSWKGEAAARVRGERTALQRGAPGEAAFCSLRSQTHTGMGGFLADCDCRGENPEGEPI